MQVQYPSLLARVQSSFIDGILLLISILTFVSIGDKYHLPESIKIVFIILLVAYEPICMSLGCTLGNFVKGIRVRNHQDTTKRISILPAILRYIVKIALGWISFLTIHSDDKRRAIHDMAAGSVMIKK
jgi:uncharacterized RDD family membrane protein YckC